MWLIDKRTKHHPKKLEAAKPDELDAPAPSGVRKKLELYPWRKPKGERK